MVLLIKCFALAWVIIKFEPLQKLIQRIRPTNFVTYYFTKLFQCLMCASFWITLITAHDIYLASISAFIAFWYTRYITPLEQKITINNEANRGNKKR